MIEYTVKVFANGDKYWCLDGEYHREDGPAIEYVDGERGWYLNDKSLTEDEFNEAMNPTKELTVSGFEVLLGYKIKLVGEDT